MLPLLAVVCALFGTAFAGSTMGGQPSAAPPKTEEPIDDAPVRAVPREALHEIGVVGEGIGDDRSAYVWVPKGKGPFPVLFAVHGGKRHDGRDMVAKFKAAQARGVLLVYPNGGKLSRPGRGWMGPDKEGSAAPDRDVRYMRALIRTLEEKGYPIQRERMYATGMSGGGYMTDLMWCEMSDTFAGFGVVARAMPRVMSQTCQVARPRPYLLMLGTADDGLLQDNQLSPADTRAFVRTQLGCPEQPVLQRTLPDRGDALQVHHTRWVCEGGVPFDDYEVEGGGHSWPGAGPSKPDKTVDIDATEVILEAFGL